MIGSAIVTMATKLFCYVAQSLGITQSCSCVRRPWGRFLETGSYSRRPGTGRQRCTIARDDRFLTLAILRNRTMTAVEVRNRLAEVRDVHVSDRTIRRRLSEVDLMARRPAHGPELTRQHRVNRLAFAHEHENWNMEQWSQVLFTDKSRFCLRAPDGRQRIWERAGKRAYGPCVD
jgi:transposase